MVGSDIIYFTRLLGFYEISKIAIKMYELTKIHCEL